MTDPLSPLLHASHLLEPADLPGLVAGGARALGAVQTVLYLADHGQTTLRPLPGPGVPDRQEQPIEGTVPGRVFSRVEVVTGSADDAGSRWWLPLLDGLERLGVVEMVFGSEPDAGTADRVHAFVTLVADLIVARDAYSDVFARIRRRRPMSLAAEMQWELLPRAAVAAGDPAPETVRRLMSSALEHQAGRLQDDASVVVLEWLAGAAQRTLPSDDHAVS